MGGRHVSAQHPKRRKDGKELALEWPARLRLSASAWWNGRRSGENAGLNRNDGADSGIKAWKLLAIDHIRPRLQVTRDS